MAHRTWLTLLALAGAGALAAPLGGCFAPLVAAGAGAGAGYAVLGQERSPKQMTEDAAIGAVVAQSWKQYNVKLADDLSADVYDGRVLVTGQVPTEAWRDDAVARAWKADGVKAVYNEITVGPESAFMQDVSDDKITTTLSTQLKLDGDVKSINYSIHTVQGTVYLMGSARSQDELNRVIDHARNIANVKRVKSYVQMRSGEPAAAQAQSPPPAGAPAASAPASAAPPPAASAPSSLPPPSQPIQATPLK